MYDGKVTTENGIGINPSAGSRKVCLLSGPVSFTGRNVQLIMGAMKKNNYTFTHEEQL
jgi:hypothetical protein